MKIFINKNDLIKFAHNEKNLGFVPTMGAIHPGHISLIKKSIRQCSKTIVSIFINKPQFNRKSDFKNYPRDTKKDIKMLKKLNLDYLFLPTNNEIYPDGANKKINISPFAKKLCGKSRPDHFKSVADVIDRFIKIIKPNKIYFGEKDMQQLKIIEDFISRNKIITKVIGCKTIREKNGIAYSSRNLFLSKIQKKIASKVYKILIEKKKFIVNKKITLSKIEKKILELGVNKIDYIKILDINKINHTKKKNKKYKVFIAYFLGSTRLIDNI